VPAGEGVAASAVCSWALRWGPGGPASATGEDGGEFGTDGARTTVAVEHFTSAAVLVRERETQGSTGEGKRARKNSCSCFIGQRRERERRPGQLAINGHDGRRVN
jgi:hypothetical protein